MPGRLAAIDYHQSVASTGVAHYSNHLVFFSTMASFGSFDGKSIAHVPHHGSSFDLFPLLNTIIPPIVFSAVHEHGFLVEQELRSRRPHSVQY